MNRVKLYLLLVMSLITFALNSQSLNGDWEGFLNVSGRQLKIVFHISDGDKIVTMDSPSQNAYGIKCVSEYLSCDSLAVSIPQLKVLYSGCRVNDNISGTFNQAGLKLPLMLKKSKAKLNRPQTPIGPFPYSIKEVVIENKESRVVLAGTLTIPQGATKSTPVVVLITGSGPQNRDEEIFEHKPFMVIADYLARHGIASLRYDDRGVGKSTGDYMAATTSDFARDALSVVKWLHTQNQFGKIGILGHSEGGIIAYMLGTKKNNVDFIVSIAGPSVPGVEIIAWQNKVQLLKSGVAENEAERFRNAMIKACRYKLDNLNASNLDDSKLEEFYPGYSQSPTSKRLAQSLKSVILSPPTNHWMIYFLRHDPSVDLAKINIPALIIYGEKDLQVPPALNADVAKSYAKNATLKVYPGLNHLMQHAKSGQTEEYRQIEETISEEVLADIVEFIKDVNKKGAK